MNEIYSVVSVFCNLINEQVELRVESENGEVTTNCEQLLVAKTRLTGDGRKMFEELQYPTHGQIPICGVLLRKLGVSSFRELAEKDKVPKYGEIRCKKTNFRG